MNYETIVKAKYIKALKSIIDTRQDQRVLTCVHVVLEADQTVLMATDSFKLAKITIKNINPDVALQEKFSTSEFKISFNLPGLVLDIHAGKNDVFKLTYNQEEKVCEATLYDKGMFNKISTSIFEIEEDLRFPKTDDFFNRSLDGIEKVCLSSKYLEDITKVYKVIFGTKDAKPILKFHGENKFVSFYQEGEGIEVESVLMSCRL